MIDCLHKKVEEDIKITTFSKKIIKNTVFSPVFTK